MSLINTNHNYLETMGIAEGDLLVGIIVLVYYLGCAIGAVLFSGFAGEEGCNILLSGDSQSRIHHYAPRWCQRHRRGPGGHACRPGSYGLSCW
jgi:hypothetical protein